MDVDPVPVAPAAAGDSTVHLSTTRFQDLAAQGIICPPVGRALKEVIGHEFLTQVQDKTMLHILNGSDCLAQAKTGTGKTLGFLIPAIEKLYRSAYAPGKQPVLPHPNSVSILVVSPTRELAQQIEVEAELLLRFLPFKSQCVIGGTNMSAEAKRLAAADKRVDILIATPGRLKDHLENSNLKQGCANLQVLIFDEADRLLDEGFKRDMDQIIAMLPRSSPVNPRQTLLFSATIPPSVHQVAKQVLQPNFKFITTIAEYESSTHEHVPQHQLVVPMQDLLISAVGALNNIVTLQPTPPPKIIMFFPTARQTQLFAELLVAMQFVLPVFEIHSRKSQSARTKATDQFRLCERGVMVSSDVSARGMDFPGVTHVVQVGIPANHIHRLGRTARAGSSGTGLILLADFERFFLGRHLGGLPIKPYPYPTPSSPALSAKVAVALSRVSTETKGQAYQAWLGFYNGYSREIGWSKEQLVAAAGEFAVDVCGCASVPGLERKTVGKMGLKGVAGLVYADGASGGGGGGGGGGQRGGRGGGQRGGGGQQMRGGGQPQMQHHGQQQQQSGFQGNDGNTGRGGSAGRGRGRGAGGRGGQGQRGGRGGGHRGGQGGPNAPFGAAF
ncbi:hypothetical protein HDU98_000048 [Podochytrium sp. JEL0797]|nr:hypothetical protein HDU98_000048 [Podochytrium sp. JEL0797]